MKTMTFTRESHPAYFQKCKTFGQLLAVVEKQGETEDMFVSKVYLNDKLMDQDEENLLESMGISQVQTIKVEMCSISELLQKSVTNIIRSIQTTQNTAIEFAKEFRKMNSVDDEKIKFILIQCRTIIESLEEIFTAHNQGKFVIKHMSLWHQSEKELSNILQCILQGRKISKAEFLADLIEYDLVHALDQWEESLEKELIDNADINKNFSLKSSTMNSDNGVDA